MTTLASIDDNGVGTTTDAAVTAANQVPLYLGESIPDAIQVAIMRLATYYYENRNYSPDKDFLKSLKQDLSPFRDFRL